MVPTEWQIDSVSHTPATNVAGVVAVEHNRVSAALSCRTCLLGSAAAISAEQGLPQLQRAAGQAMRRFNPAMKWGRVDVIRSSPE